ncbi:MAG: hypothetical protein QM755_23670 [Luteolibacter sp.]
MLLALALVSCDRQEKVGSLVGPAFDEAQTKAASALARAKSAMIRMEELDASNTPSTAPEYLKLKVEFDSAMEEANKANSAASKYHQVR